jgi:hypothetical protein
MASSFPNGFSNGLVVRGLPVLNTYAGKVLWVDSATGSNGNKGTFERPFATLDYAIGMCTANKGDTIMIKPNHAETITGAGGITADVAGINIVGLGTYNQRPRFLMDAATTVTFVISAADVTVQNLVFAAGHADIVTCFNITGVGAKLLDLEFVENVATENFLTPIKATGAANTADGLTIIGCRNLTVDAAAVEFLEVTDDLAYLTMRDNLHFATGGTAAPLILSAGAKNLTFVDIGWNKVQNANTANDLFIDNGGATNSGMVYNNYVGNLDVTGAQTFGAATGIQFFENLSTSTSTETGALAQAADTPLS